ncbi:uncharacterized protein LOC103318119 [Nasonia vitripennis]|uniref:C2H2-type domain-containing protein n=1 Tax=Nasonia vitripennis TaxID=7425 RepID=A0A7M7HHH5_NASVI|nr:uncharacterized protein LOC103318119 [Nasonia vitripennis]
MSRNAAQVRATSDDEEDSSQEDCCIVKRSRGIKVYECTGCRYTSQRRSNVGRHFRRIHCELKKHKRCICDEVFLTKGEYYEHCIKEHPHFRHSSYITTEKYKIGKSKSKARSGSRRQSSRAKVVEVRSSARLAAIVDECTKSEKLEAEQVAVEKNNNDGNSSPPPVVEAMDTVDVKHSKNIEPLEESKIRVYEDKCSPQPSASCEIIDTVIGDNAKLPDPSVDKENNQLRLPLKKRFRNSAVFADITNNNSSSRRNNELNKPSNIVSNNNAIQFIDQIDFDDLDAILSLAHMKCLY